MHTNDTIDLRLAAYELMRDGDIVAALLLEDLAYKLEHGRLWPELLQDVTVRP